MSEVSGPSMFLPTALPSLFVRCFALILSFVLPLLLDRPRTGFMIGGGGVLYLSPDPTKEGHAQQQTSLGSSHLHTIFARNPGENLCLLSSWRRGLHIYVTTLSQMSCYFFAFGLSRLSVMTSDYRGRSQLSGSMVWRCPEVISLIFHEIVHEVEFIYVLETSGPSHCPGRTLAWLGDTFKFIHATTTFVIADLEKLLCFHPKFIEVFSLGVLAILFGYRPSALRTEPPQ